MSPGGLIAWTIYLPTTLVAVAWGTDFLYDSLGVSWLAAYVLAINAVAFAIYGWDKGVAKVLGWLKLKDSLPLRVPENLLIWGLAFPGGIVGAVAAMVAFNHKIGSKEKADQFRIELLQAGALFTGALLIILLLVTATGIDVLVILDGIIASFVHVVLGMLGVLWSLVEQVVL